MDYLSYLIMTPDIESTDELINYLKQDHHINTRDIQTIRALKGGVSNKTMLVKFGKGNDWVLKQALEKLRVEGEWLSHPDRIFREAQAMEWFTKHLPKGIVPGLIFSDPDNHIIAMEAVDEPFYNFKAQLMQGQIDLGYFDQAGKLLAQIHMAGLQLTSVPQSFHDRHFYITLRLDPYYRETLKQIPACQPFMDTLILDTLANPYTITHGDFSPKNLLIKDDELILIDHEVIHYGDGAFDIGFFLSHILSKANHLRSLKKGFLNAALVFWNSYNDHFPNLNASIEQIAIAHTIACLLARVAGLSKLEYLTIEEQHFQVNAALTCIQMDFQSMRDFIAHYSSLLND